MNQGRIIPCLRFALVKDISDPYAFSGESPISHDLILVIMKSICISAETAVGCKKTIYEVDDSVYDYVIRVLEGEEPVPSVTVMEAMDAEPAPEM